MADRIFPNRIQEEALDSDLVFQGIDWDNFNTKLAEVKNGLNTRELPAEFKEVLAKKNMPEAVENMFKQKNKENDKEAIDEKDEKKKKMTMMTKTKPKRRRNRKRQSNNRFLHSLTSFSDCNLCSYPAR